MKRILLALLIGGVTLTSLSSCTKEYITEENVYGDSYSYFANLSTGNWKQTNVNAYYDVPVADLTNYYLQDGYVSAAISFDGEKTYNILPASFEGISYSVEYAVGRVSVYAENTSGTDLLNKIPNAKLKVVLSKVNSAMDL
ncbi:hypothetical protein FM120_25745 [Sphingobacterium faecium PCAi_F2.5]|jgi:hypothetical protein|nr:conserved exported hypothetical protein [Sphingobacterium sp. PM2-P1-29]SJN50414.1 hypothetical protein FM120_25745 [Sphingobacterium faecium PCAi_F2.5]